jgi:endonuclease YncB( thermonuclease family)
MLRRTVLLTALALPFARPALADAPSGRVVQVVDGDTLRLADGREVRLVGIQAPKLPLGRRNFTAWPLAGEAKAALEAMALNRTVRLRPGETPADRHGRVLAHLDVEGGPWVQGAMLAQGLARVYTFADNRQLARELYAHERAAREEGHGIWKHRFYRIRDATSDAKELAQSEGTFQLVEGRVMDVGETQQRTYLNFGADHREDFTVAVPSKARAAFRAGGLDLAGLRGRSVRVRGWLKRLNGPMIEINHPEPIEVL